MKLVHILALLCVCLCPSISCAETRPSPPPFVIRSADELKALPEFLQKEDLVIVPDAEVSACDPGKGLLSLMSLTPEQASQFWGMPKKRRPGSKSFLPEYSWENGYTLSFNKKGWLQQIEYRSPRYGASPLSAAYLQRWGMAVVEPAPTTEGSLNWPNGKGIVSSIYLRSFDEDLTKVRYAAIRLNDWPDAPDRSVDTPEARGGQFGFGAIIDWAAIEYRWSDSSAKREIVKLQRQRDVAEYLDEGFVFTDWIATVTDVRLKETSEPGGKLRANKSAAVIRVGFEKISLQNSWQGAGAESAIMEGSPLFDLAVKLGKGQKVLVSGRFIKGQDGGPRETSLTEEGGMREPEFDVVFTDIKVKK